MADRPSPGDWRQRKNPGGIPKGVPGATGKRDWQKQAVAPAGPKKPIPRGAKLFVALLLLGLLSGGVYLVIEWWRPVRPVAFVLLGSSYYENLAIPHNLAGWNGLVDLAKLTDRDFFSGKPSLAFGPQELKGAAAFDKEWTKLARKLGRENVVLVFVSLHGSTDRRRG